jgi:hypothetical protein
LSVVAVRRFFLFRSYLSFWIYDVEKLLLIRYCGLMVLLLLILLILAFFGYVWRGE